LLQLQPSPQHTNKLPKHIDDVAAAIAMISLLELAPYPAAAAATAAAAAASTCCTSLFDVSLEIVVEKLRSLIH